MLERLLVALPAGGHVLLEGVPGLDKTLTVKTVADVLGGRSGACSSPDLVPAELVGTRIDRPDTGNFDSGFPRWRIARRVVVWSGATIATRGGAGAGGARRRRPGQRPGRACQ